MEISSTGPNGEPGELVFPHEAIDCMIKWRTTGLVIYFRGGSHYKIEDQKMADTLFAEYQNWLMHR